MSEFPYLKESEIEYETLQVLQGFEKKYGTVQTVAIPIDEIVEKYLKFSLEFNEDLGSDILGCIDCENNQITINASLDTSENPKMEGRYHYTVAHEGGHGVLHKHIILLEKAHPDFFAKDIKTSTILCRKSNETDRVEWQANFFASCILMPKNRIVSQWKEFFGNAAHIIVPDLARDLRRYSISGSNNYPKPLSEILPSVIGSIGGVAASDKKLVENYLKPFAELFHVSAQALYIRLIYLGLLREKSAAVMSLV